MNTTAPLGVYLDLVMNSLGSVTVPQASMESNVSLKVNSIYDCYIINQDIYKIYYLFGIDGFTFLLDCVESIALMFGDRVLFIH